VFCIAWRNPRPEHDHWGMAAYQDSIDAAVDAVREISGADSVNLWAVCGAGPVVAPLLGYYRAIGERKVNSLMLFVSPLDLEAISEAPMIGAFADKRSLATVKRLVRHKRMSAKEFTLLFAMLRANDLIWNYWVNNYLLGDRPAAFDVMYWNADGTGMTAQYNQEFSGFVERNPLPRPGSTTVRGLPVPDLSTLDIDSYVLGAVNDHLCLWQGVYRSAQLLGDRSRYVLGNSGHIQTIVCPPGNPKASYYTNPELPPSPEEWLKAAKKNAGSWWDDFAAWTAERAGGWVPARNTLGSERHPPLWAAPGTYVLERV
jgi:polyhydroxyalkanoate synthase